ncbi:unnamed protein product, partial [Heterosigma akashiwo]
GSIAAGEGARTGWGAPQWRSSAGRRGETGAGGAAAPVLGPSFLSARASAASPKSGPAAAGTFGADGCGGTSDASLWGGDVRSKRELRTPTCANNDGHAANDDDGAAEHQLQQPTTTATTVV